MSGQEAPTNNNRVVVYPTGREFPWTKRHVTGRQGRVDQHRARRSSQGVGRWASVPALYSGMSMYDAPLLVEGVIASRVSGPSPQASTFYPKDEKHEVNRMGGLYGC